MPPNRVISPIPQYNPNKKILRDQVAELPPQEREPETETFTLCFDSYRDDLSEISSLSQICAQKVLSDFRMIGDCYDLHSLKNNGIQVIPVRFAGDYKKLFLRLTSDINILEHKVHQNSRIFYYIVRKKCYIITITFNHYETDKVR